MGRGALPAKIESMGGQGGLAYHLLLWFSHKLLKGVTIASGGVLPNIHPELLAKKRGSKGKLEAIITPPPAKKAKSPSQKKPVSKKAGGKKGARKSKVCDLAGVCGEGQGR